MSATHLGNPKRFGFLVKDVVNENDPGPSFREIFNNLMSVRSTIKHT
jgi:hypothetical protein